MKCKLFFARSIMLVSLICLLNNSVYSQGTDYSRGQGEPKKLFVSISLDPAQTSIINEFNSLALTSKAGNSLNGKIEFGYYFSKSFGISIGLGYSSFSSKLLLNKDTCSFRANDSEEDYTMQVTGKSITEDQKIAFLSIPLCLAFRLPLGNKWSFLLQAGLDFGIPILKTYSESGIFTYEGYYKEYPVLLHDIPKFGFATDTSTKVSGNYLLKSFNVNIMAVGSIQYSLSEKISISIGIYFTRSLTNISAYKKADPFLLSTKLSELNSFMEGSSNTGVQALGLNIGLRYYIK